jgi:hypothetical protein
MHKKDVQTTYPDKTAIHVKTSYFSHLLSTEFSGTGFLLITTTNNHILFPTFPAV